jgi:hypothetical protein
MTRLHKSQLRAIAPQVAAGVVPVVPAPPKRKVRDNEEWRIQSAFFRWWRASAQGLGVWPGLLYHVPNGSMLGDDSKSRAIRAKMLAQAGVVNGVVDCFLAVPKEDRYHGIHRGGMYFEFKKPSQRTKKNGGLSDAQHEFLSYAMARGYACHVCYSWEEARDVVVNYLQQ